MSHIRPWTAASLGAVVTASLVALVLATPAGAAPTVAPTTGPTLGTSPSPPGPPTDVHASAVSARSITIAWTAAVPTTTSIAGYDITWNQAFNDVYHLQTLGNVTSWTLDSSSGVQPTGQYSFRVTARDGLGHPSTTSGSVTVVTPASDTAADRTPPGAVTGLQISGSTLTWAPTTDDVAVTGYDVYRFDGLYISTLLGTVTGTTFAVTPASGINIYYVRARDAAGNLGISSNIVSGGGGTTTPPPPPTCQVTVTTTAQWAGGFVDDVTVANSGPAAISNWVLVFRFGGDQRVTNAWNATYTQTGADVTLTGAGWNRTIPAGGSATAGIMGRWTSSAAPPTQATLNGAPCTLA